MSNGVNFKDLCIDLRGQLDRVTAERDAALGREADLVERQGELRKGITEHWQVVCDQRANIDALQQHLAAADDQLDDCGQFQQRQIAVIQERNTRVEVLEGLLRRAKTYGGLTPAWHDAVEGALKPAEQDEYIPDGILHAVENGLEVDAVGIAIAALNTVEPPQFVLQNGHFEGQHMPGFSVTIPPGSVFTIIPTDSPNKMCDWRATGSASQGVMVMSEGVRAAICGVAAIPCFSGLAMLAYGIWLEGWVLLAAGFGIAAIARIK